jgi:DNA-binding YbaB/EbfC family protein
LHTAPMEYNFKGIPLGRQGRHRDCAKGDVLKLSQEVIMKGMPNMGKLMKQAQQLQTKMAKMQEELSEKTVEASAGGGMIIAVANGRQELVSIQIEKEVIDPEDAEMLQDLIMAAVNDALNRAKEMMNEEMGKVTQGMNIPGMPGMF